MFGLLKKVQSFVRRLVGRTIPRRVPTVKDPGVVANILFTSPSGKRVVTGRANAVGVSVRIVGDSRWHFLTWPRWDNLIRRELLTKGV